MQSGQHLVSLYVATCGQNGPGLGSDEKEIVLLTYVILAAETGHIIGTKQILVRPDGGLPKDRCNLTSSDQFLATAVTASITTTSTKSVTTSSSSSLLPMKNNYNVSTKGLTVAGTATATATVTAAAAPETTMPISTPTTPTIALGNGNQSVINGAINTNCNNNNNNNNSSYNNNNNSNTINTINASNKNNNAVITDPTNSINATTNNDSITNTTINTSVLTTITMPLPDNSNNNNTNNNTLISNNNSSNYSNSNSNINNMNNNNKNNNNMMSEISSNGDDMELPPIALAMTVGKPLQEAIREFDDYLNSLALRDTNFKIITDGQLPLRQCLHREACAKDIILPTYYNQFSDLRKEYTNFKTGDMSRALVAVKDIPKILQLPATLLPQSIHEIMKDLNITSSSINDNEFYMRECRDMVSVIQHLLKFGHKFTANETVNIMLEPGICSIDDKIDGNCIVRARGLPWQSSDQDIAKFFRGLNVAKGGVALCLSPLGRRNGEALVRFISQEHRDMALKRHKHHIGNRYIEVYRATGDDFLSVAGGASNEALAFLSKGAQVIIRMRGLPYDCTAKQVLDFFTSGENPCHVLDGTEGVLFVKKPDGRATGDAFVLFANDVDAPKALAKHRESIGQRYIELFRSTTAEVQQVLNRSLDPKTYEPNNQPPLIAQLPMQLSILPQHLITSGTTKNCIRLRGLPYEAMVEHILHFLDDFAKHIIFQGVHMVINAQGHPSGEAFIEMDSEESARLCAQRKHHQFMVFGKKYRYIEVFQCCGDDMNTVLNGGIQSPVNIPGHPHQQMPNTKQQAALLSPGMLSQQQQPSNAQSLSTHATHAHTHVHSHHSHHHHTDAQIQNHALQTAVAPSMAATVAHLSQTQRHVAMSGLGQQARTVNQSNIPSYMAAAASGGGGGPSTSITHPSFTQSAAVLASAAAAQNAAAAAVLASTPTPQLQIRPTAATAAATAVSPQAAMTFPFNLSLPPPPNSTTAAAAAAAAVANSALIAQQQAQFIAQQNLLARQQAAAAASVAAEHQQSLYAANMSPLFIQPATAAGTGPTTHTPFLFMPRPYFQPISLGFMSEANYQFAGVMPSSTATPSAAMHINAGGNVATVSPANFPSALKRSYENAFQHEANEAVTAAKRALTRPPANFYQFYNPGL